MRHGEAEYRTLVEGTVPATVEQTAAELDNYALAVGGPDKVPADWSNGCRHTAVGGWKPPPA